MQAMFHQPKGAKSESDVEEREQSLLLAMHSIRFYSVEKQKIM